MYLNEGADEKGQIMDYRHFFTLFHLFTKKKYEISVRPKLTNSLKTILFIE